MEKIPSDADTLRFASQVAHQLNSPIAAVSSLLRALQDGHAGALTDQQKDVLGRALARCDQALETSRRMLSIAQSAGGADEGGIADLAVLARLKEQEFAAVSAARDISLSVQVLTDEAWAAIGEAAVSESLHAVLDNAFKYTPDHGHIRVTVAPGRSEDTIGLSVADSGVGIPESEREKVFIPFHRGATARSSSRPGTGLGLALVKAAIDAAGGRVRIGESDLGGADVTLELRRSEAPAAPAAAGTEGPPPLRVIIVGGVAAGPKAAAKIIRMLPHAEVTIVERERTLAYAGCGLPYYISGAVVDQRALMSTPLGMVRDLVFFQNVKNVRVMDETEAVEIDRAGRRIRVRHKRTGHESWLEYDRALLATGARPIMPNLPGIDLANVFTLHGVRDAEGIRATLAQTRAHDVVILGGGLIGVEATEALVRKGCRVTIVEKQPQILYQLDWEMAELVARHMQAHGVKILTGTRVTAFEGEGRVQRVVTDRGTLPADMVVVAAGVRPNVALASAAGLALGTTGAIKVDARMRTSDPDIFAAGDCVESVYIPTGEPCWIPRGSTANRQGRVAAVNIAGGQDSFPGVLNSTVWKVFDYCTGWTGLSEEAARRRGFDAVTVLAPAPDKAHFMPDAGMVLMKLVVDAATRKVLGAQTTGPGAGDKRLDVIAMAIAAGMGVDQLANVDLCYSPQYSQAMDNVHTAANIARNKLDGVFVGVTTMEVRRMLEAKADFVFLDLRSPREYEQVRLPGAKLIPLGALRGRMGELPRDKEIVAFCSISLRGYEAARILQAVGFTKVRVMDGGIEMWPYEKLYG